MSCPVGLKKRSRISKICSEPTYRLDIQRTRWMIPDCSQIKQPKQTFCCFGCFFYELIFLIFLEVWNHSADDGPHQLEDKQMQDAQVGQIAHQGEQGNQCVTGNQCNHLNQNSLVDGSFGSEAIQDGI